MMKTCCTPVSGIRTGKRKIKEQNNTSLFLPSMSQKANKGIAFTSETCCDNKASNGLTITSAIYLGYLCYPFGDKE
jgi:hypothetical protein